MKKITILFALLITSLGVKSQFYLDINGGYGFGFPSNVLGASLEHEVIDVPTNSHVVSEKNLLGSLGQGANIQLTPGYMFNDYIGLELGINYFIGAKTVMYDSKSTFTSEALKLDHVEFSHRKDIAHSNQLRLMPSVFISTGASKKLSGYARLGIVMPIYGKVYGSVDSLSFSKYDNKAKELVLLSDEIKAEIEGSPSFGFRGAIGINYNITDQLSIFGELQVTSLNTVPKSQKVVSFKRAGEELIDNIPVYEKETQYVKSVDKTSNNKAYNPDLDASKDASFASKPKQEVFKKTSFSQLGVQIGLKYTFRKKA